MTTTPPARDAAPAASPGIPEIIASLRASVTALRAAAQGDSNDAEIGAAGDLAWATPPPTAPQTPGGTPMTPPAPAQDGTPHMGTGEYGYGPREADREAERAHAEDIANGLVPSDDRVTADAAPVPDAGDAVRMLTPHKGMPELHPGAIGVLGGIIGHPSDDGGASIMFRPRTYRDGTLVSVSGGPGTIWTPYSELRPTGRTVTVRAWRFKNGRRAAGNGEEYTYQAPLWDWCPGIPAGQPIVTHSYTVTVTVSDPQAWAEEYALDPGQVPADVGTYWLDGLNQLVPDHQKPFTTITAERAG